MSLLRIPSRMNERAQSSHITTTRLSGRWLILARVVWIVLVIFLLGTFIFSISANFAFLHQPCTGDWCMNSGYLTASEIHALPQYGLSLDVYAWSLIIINYGTALIWFAVGGDRKSTRLNSSHGYISYAVFCLKKKKTTTSR